MRHLLFLFFFPAVLACAPPAACAQPATVRQSGDAIVFDGRIDAASVDSFLRLLQDPQVHRLVITSPGGLVAPALDMGEAIHARGLDVEVPTACLSSCANYVFPAGRHKTLGHPDAVGWHGNMAHVLYLEQHGQGTWSAQEIEGARMLARREDAFYRAIGVDGFVCWFAKLPPYDVDDFYALSPADMQGFGIGDVSVRDPVPRGDPAVRMVQVDWEALRTARPQVRLAAPPSRVPRLREVQVIGATPLPGLGVPREQVPANVQSAGAAEIAQSHAPDLPGFMNRRFGSVFAQDVQGNAFQPDLSFRGYTASPLLGAQQGLSVYLDGVRLNQPFGDVVSWDLVPTAALAAVTLMPGSNPLFGLNTLGGAIALQTKDGRAFPGTALEVVAGSNEHLRTEFETGGSRADGLHWYGLASRVHDGGWRVQSPSELVQFFGKLGRRAGDTELTLTAAAAYTELRGNGLQEQALLADDFRSVYTLPDATGNRSLLLNLGLKHATGSAFFTGQAWYRAIRSGTVNGDVNDDALGELITQPQADCLGALATDPASACNGIVHRSTTGQSQFGAAAQVEWDTKIAGRDAQALLGAALDFSRAHFRQSGEFGWLDASRTVVPAGAFSDAARVDLSGRTRTWSLFGSSVVALDARTHLTLAGRYNQLAITNRDAITPGGGPGSLDTKQRFARLDPALGLTFQARPRLSFYAGANQGSRAPSPVELGCADAAQPCRLPNAFAGDPPLREVVSTTYEAGVRGGAAGGWQWNAGVFRSDNRDDLLFVATDASGFGAFRNFGGTRRQGVELGADGPLMRGWTLGVHYTWIDATFRSPETIDGTGNSSNTSAQAGLPGVPGTIAIRPGDRIPLVPRQLLKARIDWRASARWSFGADLVAAAGSNARGNENGLDRPDGVYYLGPGRSGGYAVLNVDAELRPARGWRLFVQVANLLDRRYTSASQLGATAFDGSGGFVAQPFPADARGDRPLQQSTFFAPGAPRSAWIGARYTFA